jgi:hypothetical protein
MCTSPTLLRPLRWGAALCASLAITGGCAPPPYSTEPSIVVTWPPPETTVVGCALVTVEVTNLALTDYDNTTEDVPGQGHYHVFTPAGYVSAYVPYTLARFEDISGPVTDYLTVQLINNLHEPLLDADGNLYEYKVPLNFEPGPCEPFEDPADSPGDSGMDSGMR